MTMARRSIGRASRPLPRTPGGDIDWAEVRGCLAAAGVAPGQAGRPCAGGSRALLDARARRLAQPIHRAPSREEQLEALAFGAAGERYAIETRHVLRVVRLEGLTPIPGARPELAGLVNYRGEVLPVVDLRRLLELPAPGLSELVWNVVLGDATPEFGLLAEAVFEVAAVGRADLAPPPAAIPQQARRFLRGVTAGACQLLDGEMLLAEQRLFELPDV